MDEDLAHKTLAERTQRAVAALPKTKNEAEMTVGGVTYTLRYDLGAMDAFETLRDQSIAEVFKGSIDPETGAVIMDENGQPLGVTNLRTGLILDLLWAGLLAHHGFGRAEVGHIVGLAEIRDVVPDIMKALAAGNQINFPKEENVAVKHAAVRKK
jgi:hypothetical protein